MRGISFQISNSDQNILWTILEGVECEKLWWHISEDEIYNKMGESIFKNEYINGENFRCIIHENHSIIFANLKAYLPNSIPHDIQNYEEFIKSECQLILLCADGFYYEIYAKDNSIIGIINDNAIKNMFSNIENITDENDERTIFSVI